MKKKKAKFKPQQVVKNHSNEPVRIVYRYFEDGYWQYDVRVHGGEMYAYQETELRPLTKKERGE